MLRSIISITEAGTRTVELDLAARKAIKPALDETINRLMDIFVDSGQMPEDWYELDPTIAYDNFSVIINDNKLAIIRVFCNKLSNALTEVVSKHIPSGKLVAKVDVRSNLYAPDSGIEGIKGNIQGRYRPDTTTIEIFMDWNDINMMVRHSVQILLFGESDYHISQISKTLVSTLVHEYAHFIQNVNGNQFKRNEKEPPGYAGYLSRPHEIDSFAADASSDIWSNICMDSNYPEDRIRILRDFMMNLSDGYGVNNMRFDAYYNYMRDAVLSLETKGMTQRDRDRVWKRFCKLVYLRLRDIIEHFTSGPLGRIRNVDHKDWEHDAKRLSMSQMIRRLADQEAKNYIEAYGADRILSGGQESIFRYTHAEDFIRHHYLKDQYDPEADRIIEIYRKMVYDRAKKIAKTFIAS